jgi:hypothetical protein
MQELIDVLIVRGVLVVATFVKRHPWLTLFLIILLWVLMTLPNFLAALGAAISMKTGLAAVQRVLTAVINWLGAARWRWWALCLLLFLLAPLWGAFTFVWLLFDHWKVAPAQPQPAEVTVAPEQSAETAQTPENFFQ